MEMRDRNAQFTPVKQAARCHQKSATAARAASKARARSEHSGGLQRTSAARAGRVDAQLQALWRPVCLHHPWPSRAQRPAQCSDRRRAAVSQNARLRHAIEHPPPARAGAYSIPENWGVGRDGYLKCAAHSARRTPARVCARASTTTVLMRCAAAKASPGASARSEMTAWMRAGHCSCARARTSACILLPRPEMRMTRFLMLHMRYSEAMLEFPCYFQEFRTAVLARGAAPSSAAVRNTSFCPNGDCTCL